MSRSGYVDDYDDDYGAAVGSAHPTDYGRSLTDGCVSF